jgi:histidine triad (HIT) family protein
MVDHRATESSTPETLRPNRIAPVERGAGWGKVSDMADCLFCRILAGEIPSKKVFEDDRVYAFEDINPQAPLHVLVIPKKHVATLNDLNPGDDEVLGYMHRVAGGIARDRGVDESGYRTVFNVNRDGGQVVFHIHLHLLGGRAFAWPPG